MKKVPELTESRKSQGQYVKIEFTLYISNN